MLCSNTVLWGLTDMYRVLCISMVSFISETLNIGSRSQSTSFKKKDMRVKINVCYRLRSSQRFYKDSKISRDSLDESTG